MCFGTRIKKVEIKIKHILFFIIFFYWITCLSLLRGLIHSHLHDSIDFFIYFYFLLFFLSITVSTQQIGPDDNNKLQTRANQMKIS